MIDHISHPLSLPDIDTWTQTLGFTQACTDTTGALLRTLAASKPGGTLLELGTGTGAGACWLLDGMTANARLTTIDNDPTVLHAARSVLGEDPRFTPVDGNAAHFIATAEPDSFDLIYADTGPGKFDLLPETIALLKPGGLYVTDDLAPHPDWAADQAENIALLSMTLEAHADLRSMFLEIGTGIMVCAKQ